MKRNIRFMIFSVFMLLLSNNVNAQETMVEDVAGIGNEWKYAFSKEGRKQWKPEFTLRYQAGLGNSGPMLNGGVKFDEKRTASVFLEMGDCYIDYAPGNLYSAIIGLNYRRYFHLGKRKIFAFYTDIYLGGGWIYKIDGKYHYPGGVKEEIINDNMGDAVFVAGIQPGLRARLYKNLHLFLGPTIATDCLGLHLGIGF